MPFTKIRPVSGSVDLVRRLDRLLGCGDRKSGRRQMGLDLDFDVTIDRSLWPGSSIHSFLDFLVSLVPKGDVYLFGGVLRDLSLYGKGGFESDLDIVVDGNWWLCERFLIDRGANKNKFGGFRLHVAGWPVDIWNAEETWAIGQGFVEYEGVTSLLRTTVLNWDSVLMGWRSKKVFAREGYFEDLKARRLGLVLEANPNPLGMAVRVFRHLVLKDARQVTAGAAEYLARCANHYSFTELREAERRGFGCPVIKEEVVEFFKLLDGEGGVRNREKVAWAVSAVERKYGIRSEGTDCGLW